jgi:hypothetical protein
MQCFGNWICFGPQVRGAREDTDSVGFLRRRVKWLWLALSKEPNRVGVFPLPPHLRMETDKFLKRCVFYFLEYQTMGKVQKPSNSEYYIPLSEPFWIDSVRILYFSSKSNFWPSIPCMNTESWWFWVKWWQQDMAWLKCGHLHNPFCYSRTFCECSDPQQACTWVTLSQMWILLCRVQFWLWELSDQSWMRCGNTAWTSLPMNSSMRLLMDAKTKFWMVIILMENVIKVEWT